MNKKHLHFPWQIIGLMLLFSVTPGANSVYAVTGSEGELVILLHGLGRSAKSMRPMAVHLTRQGYTVCNLNYPSTEHPIEELSRLYLEPVITQAESRFDRIHFVTHSMGGILVRYYLDTHKEILPGRVVMLAPPNSGSELADLFGDNSLFRKLLGPAFSQLATSEQSLVNSLPPLHREIAVIAGNRSLNPLSSLLIEGSDDGKVAVSRTVLPEMSGHLVLPVSHTFIMMDKHVLDQTGHFLASGSFFPR